MGKGGDFSMSVVPHNSDQTESKPVEASRSGVVALATSVFARTKDATTSALSKVSGGKRETLQGRIASMADKAASEETQPGSTAKARKVGLARVAEIGRDSVLPEIERTSAKLRERTRPDRLKQDYQKYLHLLHERVLDPPTETLFFTPTKDHSSGRSPRSTTISRGSPSSIMAPARGACCCSHPSILSPPSAASSSPRSCMTPP
jgi:hypothetical protein